MHFSNGEILLHHYDFTGDFAGDGNWLDYIGESSHGGTFHPDWIPLDHGKAMAVSPAKRRCERKIMFGCFSVLGQEFFFFFRTDLDCETMFSRIFKHLNHV